jgi:hypothetical protein
VTPFDGHVRPPSAAAGSLASSNPVVQLAQPHHELPSPRFLHRVYRVYIVRCGVAMPYVEQGVLVDHSQVSGGTLRARHILWRSMIRRCYVCIALFMIAIVLAGFWLSYFGPLTRGVVAHSWVIHVHAATFMGWMALLLTQVTLVSTGRTRAHKKLGTFGIGYGVLVPGMGLSKLRCSASSSRSRGSQVGRGCRPPSWGLPDMALFGAFFARPSPNGVGPRLTRLPRTQ